MRIILGTAAFVAVVVLISAFSLTNVLIYGIGGLVGLALVGGILISLVNALIAIGAVVFASVRWLWLKAHRRPVV